MNFFSGALTGAAAGLIGDKAGDTLDDLQGKEHPLLDSCLHKDIHRIAGLLEQIKHEVDTPIDNIITLFPGGLTQLPDHEKAYTMMFAPAATSIIFQVPGVGNSIALSLGVGWNILNLPNNTLCGLPQSATASITVLFRASNVMYGSAI